MKKERLLSFNHDCVTDAATTKLLGCGAALVKNLVDLKNQTVLPTDEPGLDCAFLIDIEIYRNIRFSALRAVHELPPFIKKLPVFRHEIPQHY
jgi:hypothetical protein